MLPEPSLGRPSFEMCHFWCSLGGMEVTEEVRISMMQGQVLCEGKWG